MNYSRRKRQPSVGWSSLRVGRPALKPPSPCYAWPGSRRGPGKVAKPSLVSVRQGRSSTPAPPPASCRTRSGKGGEALARLSAAREVIYSCATPGILPDIMTSTERSASQHPPLAPRSSRGAGGRRPDGLTDREAQVLGLLAAGKSNNEIATDLVVSVHTVERHLQNAYRKVGVRNRGQAAAYIVRTAQLPNACVVPFCQALTALLTTSQLPQWSRWSVAGMPFPEPAGRTYLGAQAALPSRGKRPHRVTPLLRAPECYPGGEATHDPIDVQFRLIVLLGCVLSKLTKNR